MLTPFGKFTRKLRIDNGELLKDMAEKLGVTSSYLSAIENGKRNVPKKWLDKLTSIYELDELQQKGLKKSIEESKITNKVDVANMKNSDKDLMLALARSIEEMKPEDKEIIKKIVNKRS